MQHTDRFFDRELDDLAELLNSQARLVREAILLAEKALEDPSEEFVEEANIKDKKVNALTREIDDKAVSIIALRQPVAVDLRFIIAALKITSLFERMGDKAKAAVQKVIIVKKKLLSEIEPNVKEMSQKSLKMVDSLIAAMKGLHIEELENISLVEEEIDSYYRELTAELLQGKYSSKQSLDSLKAALAVCKSFEKIGDIAIKIARIIYFIEGGERVKNL